MVVATTVEAARVSRQLPSGQQPEEEHQVEPTMGGGELGYGEEIHVAGAA